MQINIHQTHHTLGDFDAIESYLKQQFAHPKTHGIHVFSELFLTGYPLMDMVLQRAFIRHYQLYLERINQWAQSEWKASADEITVLVGGLLYEFDHEGLPIKIYNTVYELRPGQALKPIYHKKLLPNYDIFDEEKYYTAGSEVGIFHFKNEPFGLLICEDMWASSFHLVDPVQELYEYCQNEKIQLRGIINLSASPYFMSKQIKRVERAQEISRLFGAPYIYVNKVGGEDEILFDGASFVTNHQEVLKQAKHFEKDILSLECPPLFPATPRARMNPENTWEALFRTQWQLQENHRPVLHHLTTENCEELIQALSFGLQDYARKTGFKRFSVALSGGIDSALVLALAKLSLTSEQELEAIYMPGLYSSTQSWELSEQLCKRLQIRLRHFPIKFAHSSLRNAFNENFNTPLEGLADENIQSRLRGMLLYARSNQWNSLVINTSNKSEIAVGYSTLYGDSVGAISMLGDLYKTEVFELSRYLHRKYDQLIPEGIIDREPSAELRENQTDAQSLPPYERLDVILDGLLSYRYSVEEIVDLGFERNEVEKVYGLYQKSEYKRKQFCPIIKVKAKSFGFGYRVPITKKTDHVL
jgi:NAD+ synthase (glutamine-hydrolysing)